MQEDQNNPQMGRNISEHQIQLDKVKNYIIKEKIQIIHVIIIYVCDKSQEFQNGIIEVKFKDQFAVQQDFLRRLNQKIERNIKNEIPFLKQNSQVQVIQVMVGYIQLAPSLFYNIQFQIKQSQPQSFSFSWIKSIFVSPKTYQMPQFLEKNNYILSGSYLFLTKYSPQLKKPQIDKKQIMPTYLFETYQIIYKLVTRAKQLKQYKKYYEIYKQWGELHAKIRQFGGQNIIIQKQLSDWISRSKNQINDLPEMLKIICFILTKSKRSQDIENILMEKQAYKHFQLQYYIYNDQLQAQFVSQQPEAFLLYIKLFLYGMMLNFQQIFNNQKLNQENQQIKSQIKQFQKLLLIIFKTESSLQIKGNVINTILKLFLPMIVKHKILSQIIIMQIINNKTISLQAFVQFIVQSLYQKREDKHNFAFEVLQKIFEKSYTMSTTYINQKIKKFISQIFEKNDFFRFENENFCPFVKKMNKLINSKNLISNEVSSYLKQKIKNEQNNIFTENLQKQQYFLDVIKMMMTNPIQNKYFQPKYISILTSYMLDNIQKYKKNMVEIYKIPDNSHDYHIEMHTALINNMLDHLNNHICQISLQKLLIIYNQMQQKQQEDKCYLKILQTIQNNLRKFKIKTENTIRLLFINYQQLHKHKFLQRCFFEAISNYQQIQHDNFYIYKLLQEMYPDKKYNNLCKQIINTYCQTNINNLNQISNQQYLKIFIYNPNLFKYVQLKFNQQDLIQKDEVLEQLFYPNDKLSQKQRLIIMKNQNIYRQNQLVWPKFQRNFYFLSKLPQIKELLQKLQNLMHIVSDYKLLGAKVAEYNDKLTNIRQYNMKIQQFNQFQFKKDEIQLLKIYQNHFLFNNTKYWKQLKDIVDINNLSDILNLYNQFQKYINTKQQLINNRERLTVDRFYQNKDEDFIIILRIKKKQQTIRLINNFYQFLLKKDDYFRLINIFSDFIQLYDKQYHANHQQYRIQNIQNYLPNQQKLYKLKQQTQNKLQQILRRLQMKSHTEVSNFLLKITNILYTIKSGLFLQLKFKIQKHSTFLNQKYLIKWQSMRSQQSYKVNIDKKQLKIFIEFVIFVENINHLEGYAKILSFYKNFIMNYQEEKLQEQMRVSQDLIDRLIQLQTFLQDIPTAKIIQKILSNSFCEANYQKQQIKMSLYVKINQRNNMEYPLERLMEIKDTANLQKSDFDQNNEAQRNQLNVYNIFINLIDIIIRIKNSYVQLIGLGYNLNNLFKQMKTLKVIDQNIQSFQRFANKIEKSQEDWSITIKQLYKTSFISTHFIGFKFIKFISDFFNNSYNVSLDKIANMKLSQFQPISDKLSLLDRDMFDEKYKELAQLIIEQVDNSDKKNIIYPISRVNRREINPIKYIKCSQVSLTYKLFSIARRHASISINKALFCNSQTSQLQIYCFLNRISLDCSNTYYIIKPSKLNQNVILHFIKQLSIRHQQGLLLKINLQIVDIDAQEKIYKLLKSIDKFNIKYEEFTTEKLQNNKHKMQDIQIVESLYVGLGKTFYIKNKSKKQNRKLKRFPVCGNFQFLRLKRRLYELQLAPGDDILIQIGYTQKSQMLHTFLIQLILFKGLYQLDYFILPRDIKIYVQIQNFEKSQMSESFPVLKYLKQLGRRTLIQSFQIENIEFEKTYNENFVLHYLQLYQNNKIGNVYLQYQNDQQNQQLQQINQKQKTNLIQRYFVQMILEKGKKPNYFQLKCFFTILLDYFRAFSKCIYVNRHILMEQSQRISIIRPQYIKTFIENTHVMIEQTVFTSNFTIQQKPSKEQTILTDDNLNRLLILTKEINKGKSFLFQYVYLDDKSISNQLKQLFVTQNPQNIDLNLNQINNNNLIQAKFQKTALNKLSQEKLFKKIQQLLKQFSPNPGEELINDQKYELTLDNFYKMSFIIQRANCLLPMIIMGESGVGKTCLIEFLAKNILKLQLIKVNIHAGVQEQELAEEMEKIIKKASQQKLKGKKIWVFFDQFNTTSCLSYFKHIIMDKCFLNTQMPDNIVYLAACNPYRFKQKAKHNKAGLAKLQNKNMSKLQQKLAFDVKPPPQAMLQSMWNYGQLKQHQLRKYITRMINSISIRNPDLKLKIIQSLIFTHQTFLQQRQASSISLRDVYRFNKLFKWFLGHMPSKEGLYIDSALKPKSNNYRMDRQQRAIILSFMFSYVFKYSSIDQRDKFISKIQNKMGFKQGYMNSVLKIEELDYVSRLMEANSKIAYNKALRQNIFITMVCISNKIPILIIGSPGSSKSLAISLIERNLDECAISNDEFFQNFCKIHVFYYQGSIASTSQSVITKFQNAKRQNEYAKTKNMQDTLFPCIIFDEIGLAERSKYNPLKVLHAELQTHSTNICFIGISNFQLDAAKMSRFLILARSIPQKKQIIQTSIKLSEIYIQNLKDKDYKLNQFTFSNRKIKNFNDFFEQIAINYYDFIQKWNSSKKKDFFGLRDFYSYLKFICHNFKYNEFKLNHDEIQKVVSEAICLNFDGQEGSIQMFHDVSQIALVPSKILNYNQMIHKNLGLTQSRSILLIGDVQCFVQFLGKNLYINNTMRKMIYSHGSIFPEDQNSQSYALKSVASYLNYMSNGTIICFININENTQTSLYDVFNKNYIKSSCKVSIGTKTKVVYIHPNYNSIVFVNSQLVHQMNPAFLNRFQKHQLNLSSLLNQQQQQIFQILWKWLQRLLSFLKKDKNIKLKRQNFIYNISKQSIQSLIIKKKHRIIQKNQLIKQLKIQILRNATFDMQIAMKKYQDINKECQYGILKKLITPYKESQNDMIIITYNFTWSHDDDISVIHFQNYQNQQNFKENLGKQLKNTRTSSIEIYISSQKYYHAIHYILFVINELKYVKNIKKICRLVIFMNRFSLIARNKQSILLNHLENVDQYFVEDIKDENAQAQMKNLIHQSKTLLDLFQYLNMDMNDNSKYSKVLRLIKLDTSQIGKKYSEKFIQKIFYEGLVNLLKDEKIQHLINNKICAILGTIDAQIENLLQFQVKRFANFKQSISQYVESQIIKILVPIIRNIISNQQLFILTEKRIFIYQQILSNIKNKQILQQFDSYIANLHILQPKLMEKRINLYIDKIIRFNEQKKVDKNIIFSEQAEQFKVIYGVQKNIIVIPQHLSIIPQCYKFMVKIFNIDSIKLESLQQQINDLQQQLPADKNKTIKKIKNSTIKIVDEIQNGSIYFKNLNKSKFTKYLFFYDTINFYLRNFYYPNLQKRNRIQQNVDNIKTVNSQIFNIFNHFFRIVQGLSQQLWLLCINKKYLNLYIDLLVMLEEPTLIKLQFQLKQQMKKIEDNMQHSLKILIGILIQNIFKEFCQFKGKNPRNLFQSQNSISKLNKFQVFYDKIQKIKNDLQIQINPEIKSKITLMNNLICSIKNIFDENGNQLFCSYLQSKNQEIQEIKIINFFQKQFFYNKRIVNQNKISFLVNYFCYNLLLPQRKYSILSNQKSIRQIIHFYLNKTSKFDSFGQNLYQFLRFILRINENIKQNTPEYIINIIQQKQLEQISIQLEQREKNPKLILIFDNFFTKLNYQIFSDHNKQQFLIKYYQLFKNAQNHPENYSYIINLYKKSFMKIYIQFYIQLLLSRKNCQILRKIDDLMMSLPKTQTKNKIIYMLKLIANDCKNYEEIIGTKDKINAKWFSKYVETLQSHISQSEFQMLIPASIKNIGNQKSIIQELLKQDSKIDIARYLKDSLIDQYLAYQLLTFFMVKIYGRSSSEEEKVLKQRYKLIVEQCDHINNPQHKYYKELIFSYIDGQVLEKIDSLDGKQQQDQLCLLNYLNVIVSSRLVSSPLTEMFFNKGKPIKNYQEWINQRHLLYTIINPCYLNLQFLIKSKAKGNVGSSYIICSKNCHYIKPVGGRFEGKYYGCAHAIHKQPCLLCGGILGGTTRNNVLLRASQGSRIIQVNNLQQQQNNILMAASFNFNKRIYHQKGNQINLNQFKILDYVKQIRQSYIFGDEELFLNDNNPYIGIEQIQIYLISMIFLCFSFKKSLINQQELKIALKMKNPLKQFKQNISAIYNKINSYFEQKTEVNQYGIIWQYGMAAKIFQILRKNNHTTLKSQKQKLTFLKQFGQKINYLRDSNNQYAFILQNKNNFKYHRQIILEGEIKKLQNDQQFILFTKSKVKFYEVLKQLEKPEPYLIYIPQLQLFKNLNQNNVINLDQILKDYSHTLKKHQFLLLYIRNLKQTQKFKHLKSILLFISNIYKLSNRKLSKSRLNSPIKDILKQLGQDQYAVYIKQLHSYVEAWNYFSQNKQFNLSYNCQDVNALGSRLIQINQQASLRLFAIYQSNSVQGMQLISFLQIIAKEYNTLLQKLMGNLIADLPQFKDISIINKDYFINPSLFTQKNKILNFSSEIVIKYLKQYSFYTPQYQRKSAVYNFTQVQKMLAKQIIGLHYIISQKQSFKKMRFIGQDNDFLNKLKQSNDQLSLVQTNQRQKIQEIFINYSRSKPQSFYKHIRNLQSLLEQIVVYCKSLKMKQENQKSIHEFIQSHKVYINRSKIQLKQYYFIDQPVIKALSIKNLADLYDLVQYYAFYNVIGQLDSRFNKNIEQVQAVRLKQLISQIKQVKNQYEVGLPKYYNFKEALYRFVGKRMITQDSIQKNTLFDHLFYCQTIWPKQIRVGGLQMFLYNEKLHIFKKIRLQNIGHLLKIIPHTSKQQKNKQVFKNQYKFNDI